MPDTPATSDTTPSSASAAEQTVSGVPAPLAPTTYRGTRIRELEAERDDLRKALHTVLTTGKSYTLSNSHAVTRADSAWIEARLSAVNAELADLMLRRPYTGLRREPTKFY